MGRFKNTSKVVLFVVSCISILFLFNIKNVEFDYDFEAFFADNDPATKFLKEHRNRFETDNDFVFISVEQQNETVFQREFLTKVQALVEDLEEDSLITSVQCLTNMTDFVKTSFSPQVFKRPYISIDQPANYAADSIRIFERPELAGFMIRDDAKALLLVVKHQQYLSKAKCDILKENLYKSLNQYSFDDYTCAGRAVGIGFYIEAMQFETLFFIGLSFILIIIFLIFMYRSTWGVLIPLSVVATSMLWIVGFMTLVGQPINLVLTTLPSIIFVVAMSDVVHLITKYFDELRLGKSQLDAIKIAYKEIGFATLLTSFTTAVGFLTLLTVGMRPVHEFGIFTAIGVVLAFVLAYTLLPALLILTKPPKIAEVSFTRNTWYPILHRSLGWVFHNFKRVLIGFFVLIGISLVGLFKVEGNYFLLEDLKESSSLRQDYKYFDQEFMGLRPFELSVQVVDSKKSIYDYDVLKQLERIDSFLTFDYGLKRTASIIQILKMANRTEHGGQADYYTFPEERDAKKFIRQFKKFDKNGLLNLFVDSTATFARFSSSTGDEGLYAVREKDKRFEEFFETEIDQNLIEYQFTGTGHLLDRNMSTLSINLTKGLLLAVLIVSVLMGFLYRSIKMVLIAIIPNILPLLMLAAILGFFGIQLKVSTAIIFTIAFGIAVDDTIHFMSKLKLELRKGKSFLYALKRTYLSSGRAIILTTLILCSGFLLLMFSDFLGTFYVGLLISCTLMFALLADLIFLPILLLIFYYKKEKGE
ncbi:efflux RND transporter permease subunit [Crocinitomix algicola]|uniref:efflux RND transporter permease subunit n=1 Tax=Crocinitomix algicola TaxID=1740263 RepID=UPI0008308413|nr:MMPL family transporter [Crocinitomix algicola]